MTIEHELANTLLLSTITIDGGDFGDMQAYLEPSEAHSMAQALLDAPLMHDLRRFLATVDRDSSHWQDLVRRHPEIGWWVDGRHGQECL